MKGILHLILATPGSSAHKYLFSAIEPNSSNKSLILCPKDGAAQNAKISNFWEWDDKDFKFTIARETEFEEWILFLSNDLEVADQIEATLRLLALYPDLSLGRVLVFLDSEKLAHKQDLYLWLDGCSHFADAICYTNRKNTNSKHIQDCINRYSSMRYPLETYVLNKKTLPISSLLNPVARRISHVFDPLDLLDKNESIESDPYLERHANGERVRKIPLIFSRSG
tara:strand:- start:693 stop:1367 length:675 start_codon:yes stop_codon:yes gene_type:complete